MNIARMSVGLSLLFCAVTGAPLGMAQPADSASDLAAGTADAASAPSAPAADSKADQLSDACSRFDAAVNVAAANYEDFAYASAGNGNHVDYRDPQVWRTNVIGRTALRQAAATALSASGTAGMPPEISGPMRSWSLGATKLLVVMGLRGGGDTLNSSVTDMNADAHAAQMACALAGRGPS